MDSRGHKSPQVKSKSEHLSLQRAQFPKPEHKQPFPTRACPAALQSPAFPTFPFSTVPPQFSPCLRCPMSTLPSLIYFLYSDYSRSFKNINQIMSFQAREFSNSFSTTLRMKLSPTRGPTGMPALAAPDRTDTVPPLTRLWPHWHPSGSPWAHLLVHSFYALSLLFGAHSLSLSSLANIPLHRSKLKYQAPKRLPGPSILISAFLLSFLTDTSQLVMSICVALLKPSSTPTPAHPSI